MNVEEFIEEINGLIPSDEKIIDCFRRHDKTFDYKQALVYKKNNILKITDSMHFVDPVEYLIYGTNISSVGIGGINFRSRIRLFDNGLKHFASYNDFYRFCYSPADTSVISLTDGMDREDMVAASFDDYLMLLCEHEKVYKKDVFGVDFSIQMSLGILSHLIKRGVSKRWVKELIPFYN